jgi:DNA-binding NarL/FixJ family response regulator
LIQDTRFVTKGAFTEERPARVPYRIVLANNHAPLRDLLSLSRLAPQLVIVDPSMANFQGIEAIRKVKAIYPELKVLILSMHKDKEYLSQAISSGAEGYLIKETVDKELLPAIDTIMQGRLYVPPFP